MSIQVILSDKEMCVDTVSLNLIWERKERGEQQMRNHDNHEQVANTHSEAELFQCTTLNGMELANRFVRSATWEGLADEDGAVTQRLSSMMADLAKGEVGLIISGYTFVRPEGQSSSRQMAAYDDRFLPGLRDMANIKSRLSRPLSLKVQVAPTRLALMPYKSMPPRPGQLKSREQEVYYRETAILYKQQVSIPLTLVGGIRSYEVAEELVHNGFADYIALSRPLICEPGLVKRWHEGDRRASECVSDNACFGPASDGSGVYRVTLAKKRNKVSH